MWAIVKYKSKEFNILKKDFAKNLGEMPKFYSPKIKYQKYVKQKLVTCEKSVLEIFEAYSGSTR